MINPNEATFELGAGTPCCGPRMLMYGVFYGTRIYVCRNCMKYVERKDALTALRKARRVFRDMAGDLFIRFRPTPAYTYKTGDTLKINLEDK